MRGAYRDADGRSGPEDNDVARLGGACGVRLRRGRRQAPLLLDHAKSQGPRHDLPDRLQPILVRTPPLLSEHPPALQVVLAVVVPAVYGAVTGIFLGTSRRSTSPSRRSGSWGLSARASTTVARAAALFRVSLAGLPFGACILIAHELTGNEAKAELPEPAILLLLRHHAAGHPAGCVRRHAVFARRGALPKGALTTGAGSLGMEPRPAWVWLGARDARGPGRWCLSGGAPL